MGVQEGLPVQYAHNPQVKGVQAGEEFRQAMAQIAPGVKVSVMKPGETLAIQT
jgi:hypothetical protein